MRVQLIGPRPTPLLFSRINNMNGLLPIIRRVRRPLAPPDEPIAKVAATVSVPAPDAGAEKPVEAVPPAAAVETHAHRPLQTAAAS